MSENLYAFRMGLRRIDEGGINRIMSHGKYGFIVISANRSEIYSEDADKNLTSMYEEWCEDENKDIVDKANMDFWLNKYNKKQDKNLLNDLKNSPYSYTPVYGGYHGTDNVSDSYEPSYIVYCHAKMDAQAYLSFEDLYKFALELTKKYRQDSVYIQMPNKAPIYVNGNGEQVSSKSSMNFKFNDYTQEFYTTVKRKKRNSSDGYFNTQPQRFTADIQFESMYRKANPSTYFDRMKRRKLGEVFIDS